MLQGFAGHVPKSDLSSVSQSRHSSTDWSAGFSGTWFLDLHDSLFQRMGRQRLGTDHPHAADPFNDYPPSNDSTSGDGHAIYGGLERHPAIQRGSSCTRRGSGTADEALLGAVPDDHMLVLDPPGDRAPAWKVRRGSQWEALDLGNALYSFAGKGPERGPAPASPPRS